MRWLSTTWIVLMPSLRVRDGSAPRLASARRPLTEGHRQLGACGARAGSCTSARCRLSGDCVSRAGMAHAGSVHMQSSHCACRTRVPTHRGSARTSVCVVVGIDRVVSYLSTSFGPPRQPTSTRDTLLSHRSARAFASPFFEVVGAPSQRAVADELEHLPRIGILARSTGALSRAHYHFVHGRWLDG